jgi:hypothetical protein
MLSITVQYKLPIILTRNSHELSEVNISSDQLLLRRIIPTIGSDHDSIEIFINRRNPMGIRVVDRHPDTTIVIRLNLIV